jgi:hypothetical protein
LNGAEYRITPIFHYAVIPAIGLFLSLPSALKNLERYGKIWIWVLFWTLAANGRSDLFRLRQGPPSEHVKWLQTQLVSSLSDEVSISAPDALVPHLANRRWVHWFPNYRLPSGEFFQCVLVDTSVHNIDFDAREIPRMKAQLLKEGYRKVLECHEFEAYELNSSLGSSQCFKGLPDCYENH